MPLCHAEINDLSRVGDRRLLPGIRIRRGLRLGSDVLHLYGGLPRRSSGRALTQPAAASSHGPKKVLLRQSGIIAHPFPASKQHSAADRVQQLVRVGAVSSHQGASDRTGMPRNKVLLQKAAPGETLAATSARPLLGPSARKNTGDQSPEPCTAEAHPGKLQTLSRRSLFFPGPFPGLRPGRSMFLGVVTTTDAHHRNSLEGGSRTSDIVLVTTSR